MVASSDKPEAVQCAADILAGARCILVLTGAGISTDSGIPDFRGPQGIWTKNPLAERASNIQHWVSDPSVRAARWEWMLNVRESGRPRPQPNAGHRAVAQLLRLGADNLLVTQNVDGLHQAAGAPPERIVEIHGCTTHTRCLECGERLPMAATLDRVAAGETDPHCLACGGLLKAATISFGQQLIEEDVQCAFDVASKCDVLLAVGSTLSVYPIAGVVPQAAELGSKVIIVNAEPTEMDEYADVILRSSISEVLPQIVPKFADEPAAAPAVGIRSRL